jgi:hypothetical protein
MATDKEFASVLNRRWKSSLKDLFFFNGQESMSHHEERLTKEGKSSALSFERLRGWSKVFASADALGFPLCCW